jgi:hypothetical protein
MIRITSRGNPVEPLAEKGFVLPRRETTTPPTGDASASSMPLHESNSSNPAKPPAARLRCSRGRAAAPCGFPSAIARADFRISPEPRSRQRASMNNLDENV